MLDEDVFHEVLERAADWNLRIQEHPGRRTFVATNAGYRLEVHPPREWIDDLLSAGDDLRLAELQLRADDPGRRPTPSPRSSASKRTTSGVQIGETLVQFMAGGPEGRPELHAERFV